MRARRVRPQRQPARPAIPHREEVKLWAAAAGRCTFCKAYVLENEPLGVAVPIAEMAHIVGWSKGSPRGRDALTLEQRRSVDNLILACRNCHRPIDEKGVIGKFDIATLRRLKHEHEETMRFVTGTTGNQRALVIRVVGVVRGHTPQLTRATVLTALLRADLFPQHMPGSFHADADLDLRGQSEPRSPDEFKAFCPQIVTLAARVNDAMRSDDIQRVGVFAFARIPLLVELGARLGDKIEAVIFQRQRSDTDGAWQWPIDPGTPAEFDVRLAREGDRDRVALVLSISGTIELSAMPPDCATYTVYQIAPQAPAEARIDLIASRASLANFDRTVRHFLAKLEETHGKLDSVALFPAVPLAAAVTLGRVLALGSTPAWRVFDRDSEGQFRQALEVRP